MFDSIDKLAWMVSCCRKQEVLECATSIYNRRLLRAANDLGQAALPSGVTPPRRGPAHWRMQSFGELYGGTYQRYPGME